MKNRPIKIAIINHKGGVGKTSTTIALADAFASLPDTKKVLIVEADEQANIKTVFGIKLKEADGGLAAVLLENARPESVIASVRPKIDVILSGGRRIKKFEEDFLKTSDADYILKRSLNHLTDYDFVLIDCPPALSLISSNVAHYADYAVIPSTPDMLSTVGVKSTIMFFENLERHKSPGDEVAKILGVVPTMYDQRRNLDTDILHDLQRMADNGFLAGGIVFEEVRSDLKIKTTQVKRKLLSEAAPTSKAREDYFRLADNVLKTINTRESLDKDNTRPILTNSNLSIQMEADSLSI